MGTLTCLSDYTTPETVDVYPPVNYRNPNSCVVMIFPEGGRERRLYDYQAVQYCKGERKKHGYHIVEFRQTGERGMYWICDVPMGLCVRDYKGSPSCRVYRPHEIHVVGLIFQFIPNMDEQERIEIIRGPVHLACYEDLVQTVYDVRA